MIVQIVDAVSVLHLNGQHVHHDGIFLQWSLASDIATCLSKLPLFQRTHKPCSTSWYDTASSSIHFSRHDLHIWGFGESYYTQLPGYSTRCRWYSMIELVPQEPCSWILAVGILHKSETQLWETYVVEGRTPFQRTTRFTEHYSTDCMWVQKITQRSRRVL
jgi:hypothetical protein